jgi:hypothetical protein
MVQLIDGHGTIGRYRIDAQIILDLRVVAPSFALIVEDNEATLHAFGSRIKGAPRLDFRPARRALAEGTPAFGALRHRSAAHCDRKPNGFCMATIAMGLGDTDEIME